LGFQALTSLGKIKMKSCPTCNRTFEDTFTFCLVDGSILSAPFDPQAIRAIPQPRQTEPPPTEILRAQEEVREELPPTVASPKVEREQEESVSTIDAPAPAFESPPFKASPEQPARSRLIIFGVVAVLIFGVTFFIVNRTDSTNEPAVNENAGNENTARVNTSPSPATNVSNSSTPGIGSGQENPLPSPIHVGELEESVWEGTMSNEYQRIYEFKTGGKVIEKAGGRAGVKLPMSTRTGSWTLQENRLSMKFPTTKTDSGMEIEATISGMGHHIMTGDVKWEGNPYMRDTIRVTKIR
jgi:hypothetical protein